MKNSGVIKNEHWVFYEVRYYIKIDFMDSANQLNLRSLTLFLNSYGL